ncbi:hypothetical protein BGZ61DRAFT_594007, partial [Ilyonectria robusta]|uniref:uncharacterized protein n=1 Tax=Ilyonectria robusta TaxID=1079257 RepID=UPI001E8CE1F2
MATLTQIRASNAQLTVDTVPKTVVFVGATDGIGKAALTELVSKGFPVNVYIVGRNEVAHQPLLEELRLLNSKAHLVYLEGQISLTAEAARLADEIAQREKEIDALILSPGFLPFLGRQETDEGVELSMAVAYYSRIVFISRLLRQLRAAARPNSKQYSPRIVSILGAGKETADLFLDDLTLKEPGRFSIPNYAGHVGTMTFVAMKRLAEAPENKDVVFVYAHPGAVMTNLFKKSWGDKWDDKAAPP